MKCQSFPFLTIFATVGFCTVLLFLPASIGLAAESGPDTAKIESITGLKGVLNEKENTFKVSKPRNDVAITVDKLAEGVRAIFDKVKEIRTANAQPAKSFGLGQLPEKSSIEGDAISQVFAQKGDAKDGMYKVTIGRETKMACGCTVGNTMGVNTWAAFAGTSDDALVVGDFVMLENELQTVLKTLRDNGINIVAIHQHMTGENPLMIFLHYYGRGKALALAQAVKAAINTQPLAANN